MKRISFLALILFFAFNCGLQGQELPIDPDVRVGVLKNGLHYFIAYNQRPENRAELRLAVNAGSLQEDEDQLGMAHFVEHMAFNGSENFSKNELVDYLESVGTRFGPDLNAYTSFDETVYMLQVRTDDADQFDKGMLVLEDWAGGIAFDDEEIDKERGVVISEWRTRLSADQRMQQQYFPKMFYGSRYAERLPIGDPDIIETGEYETFKRFYSDWYRPDLMAVIVVGDIDVDEVERQVKDQFASLTNPADSRPREEFEVKPHDETLVSICTDPEATFTNVRIMYKHDKRYVTTNEEYQHYITRRLFNEMLNARLYEINSVPDPPFVFASSGYGGSIGNIDAFTSYTLAPEGSALNAFEVLLTENKRVLEHGFTITELDRQKVELMRYVETQLKEKNNQQSGRLASQLVSHFLDDSPLLDPEQQQALYDLLVPTISLEDVNALAAEWITDRNRVIVFTGPEKDGLVTPTEDELLGVLSTVDAKDVEPYVDDVSEEPFFDEELEPVAIVEEGTFDGLDVHHFTLANGVKVIYKSTDFKKDEVLMTAFSPGGHSLVPDDQYQTASAIISIMRESGISDLSPPQMEKVMAGKRVGVSPLLSEMWEGFNGSCSPDDLETAFQLIYTYTTKPRLTEDALLAYKKKQETIYQNLEKNPNNYFGEQVQTIRYQNHPRRTFPKVEDLEGISLEDARSIYNDRFSDFSDFTFVFTGAFDPAELKELSASYLGNLPSTGRDEQWRDVGVTSPEGTIDTVFYKGEAPRSVVRIIYHGDFEWSQEEAFKFNRTLDYLRIKLRESLREDLGGVYGVSLYGGARRIPSPGYSINISFNADPPRVTELKEAAYAVIRDVQENGVSEDDLNKVKETTLQSRVKALEQNRYWHSGMRSYVTNDTDLDLLTLESMEARLDQLSTEEILRCVKSYFNDDNRIEAVLMPENWIER